MQWTRVWAGLWRVSLYLARLRIHLSHKFLISSREWSLHSSPPPPALSPTTARYEINMFYFLLLFLSASNCFCYAYMNDAYSCWTLLALGAACGTANVSYSVIWCALPGKKLIAWMAMCCRKYSYQILYSLRLHPCALIYLFCVFGSVHCSTVRTAPADYNNHRIGEQKKLLSTLFMLSGPWSMHIAHIHRRKSHRQ